MLRVTIWNGLTCQHLEISGNTWNLTKPHPVYSGRLIQYPSGKVTKLRIGTTGTWEYFLLGVNNRNHVISLGATAWGELPANTNGWYPAWLITNHVAKNRSARRLPAYGTANLSYATTTIVDPSKIYMGVFVVGALSAELARYKKTLGFVFKLDDPKQRYMVEAECGSLCWGLGVSGGIGLGFLTGFSRAKDMEGFTQFEYDLTAVGGAAGLGQLKTVAKGSNILAKLKPALDAAEALSFTMEKRGRGESIRDYLTRLTRALKDPKAHGPRDTRARLELMNRAREVAHQAGLADASIKAGKTMSKVEIAKLLLTCFGVDGTKKAMSCMMIGQAGAEVSLHAGYNSITQITPF
ncbi:MAG: hypothetical protein AAGJ28_12560 [Pseudomonadota bacterium]